MQDAHTLHMDISKSRLFISTYLCIHFFPMPMGYVRGATLTYKNVAWKIHGCPKPHGTKMECQIETLLNDHEKLSMSTNQFII